MSGVVIAGAGLSGLALAYSLEQAGHRVTLLESQERIGGAVHTISEDGYLLELGPNSAMERPALAECITSLELDSQIVRPAPGALHRYLGMQKQNAAPRLYQTPASISACIRTPILDLQSKLRLLLEPLIPSKHFEDESVHSYFARRLGKAMTDEIIAPMFAGIWAANLHDLSLRSALPSFWNLEQSESSLLTSMLGRKKGGKRAGIMSFRSGMGALCNALAAKLNPGTLQLGERISRIETQNNHTTVFCQSSTGAYRGERLYPAAAVVLTMPAPACADLIAPFDSTLATALQTIPYAPLGILHLAFPKEHVQHPLAGFGMLIAPQCRYGLLGAIFSSSLFPQRAPEGYHLVTCFSGGAADPENSDVRHPKVENRIVDEACVLLNAKHARVLRATYWKNAIPNYPVGHFSLLHALNDFELQNPAIRFLANWRTGISVPDRFEQAASLSKALQIQLLSSAAQDSQINHTA